MPVRCGLREFDKSGWLEADTVSHGGSSRGAFFWSLTLTDFHSGWTGLAALWGNSGGEVRCGFERMEKRMPFPMFWFDCDNGCEFLNETIEAWLARICAVVERSEEDHRDEIERAGEPLRGRHRCQIHLEGAKPNQAPGVMNPGATRARCSPSAWRAA